MRAGFGESRVSYNEPLRNGAPDLATIVGGIATSHTPSIAFAVDTEKASDPVWAPIFEGFAPVRAWLAEKAPDVLFYV